MNKTFITINSLLRSGELNTVSIPFNAVGIPVKNGKICKPQEATSKHYLTFLYSHDYNQFMIYEFNEKINNALIGYNSRTTLLDRQFVLSRFPSGKIKIGVVKADPALYIPEHQREEIEKLNSKLLSFVLHRNIGRQVLDE